MYHICRFSRKRYVFESDTKHRERNFKLASWLEIDFPRNTEFQNPHNPQNPILYPVLVDIHDGRSVEKRTPVSFNSILFDLDGV